VRTARLEGRDRQDNRKLKNSALPIPATESLRNFAVDGRVREEKEQPRRNSPDWTPLPLPLPPPRSQSFVLPFANLSNCQSVGIRNQIADSEEVEGEGWGFCALLRQNQPRNDKTARAHVSSDGNDYLHEYQAKYLQDSSV